MIGFYDYTVTLTYGGLLSALCGIFQAVNGNFVAALFCLGGALFCDTMDGKVARTKKNRTRKESLFGIQIDSLCDMVSFGAYPAILCYCAGLRDLLSFVLMGYYCLCCVIRLGYYNVMEMEKEAGTKTVYHGLPVVGLSIFMPAAFMLRLWLPQEAFLWILRALLLVVGTLYILDFPVNKPKLWTLAVLSLIFWIPVAVLCFF